MHNNTRIASFDLEERKTTLKPNSKNGLHTDMPITAKTTVMIVGFDWGTNKSCIQASFADSNEPVVSQVVPTVVGYANEGIVENLLPGNAKVLFGAEAIKNRLHLRLVQPMTDGVIDDLSAARDFARHIRSLINPPEDAELRAVIGLPANAERSARENLRQAVAGVFDRVILIPEPFLAALGYRDESCLGDSTYVDPVSNSLFVDIGGGTTDVCLVQGYFPTADDQISIPFAGDKVDALLNEAIKKTYPDCSLSTMTIRDIKEQHSYVGKLEDPIIVNVIVGGKMRKLDLGAQIGEACGTPQARFGNGQSTHLPRYFGQRDRITPEHCPDWRRQPDSGIGHRIATSPDRRRLRESSRSFGRSELQGIRRQRRFEGRQAGEGNAMAATDFLIS
jgi:actin-like ATPase involved in cell morphogenesis